MKRETLGSRLGFILLSAACAIGLGNIWRFPYIVGQYGGAVFVLIYLFFLVVLGLPIVTMELAVGRASKKSIAKSFETLEPKGTKWHQFSKIGIAGNYLLMMFYTTIAGWMLQYFVKMLNNDFAGLNPQAVETEFGNMLADPLSLTLWMAFVVIVCFGICSLGLKNGVERVTKVMMIALIGLMLVLAVRSVTLPGAKEGLSFYLLFDSSKLKEHGIMEVIAAAMNQAFFTMSIGIGSIAIFGSYINKDRKLFGEAITIGVLDTFVAIVAGLVIFPACFSFGIAPDSGPSLIFITLPNIFNQMNGGRIWGSLFFLFMTFASVSTVIAVFENIISCWIDGHGWSRKKAVLINIPLILLLSMPCVLGFNLWSSFQPFGAGTNVLDLEDFIVSNTLLPLGSIVYLLFCSTKYGWGWKNFTDEANTGKGAAFPKAIRIYTAYILPIIIVALLAFGYYTRFSSIA